MDETVSGCSSPSKWPLDSEGMTENLELTTWNSLAWSNLRVVWITLMARLTMARIKSARNEHNEAETIIHTGLPIGVRNLGDNHLGVLLARTWLARILFRQNRYEEAEEILISVIPRHKYEASRRENGDHVEHLDRMQALWFLLECYQSQGKIEEAIQIGDELWEAAHTIGGEGLGAQHVFSKHLNKKREQLLFERGGSSTESISAPKLEQFVFDRGGSSTKSISAPDDTVCPGKITKSLTA
jgi:tetratricopeptide (TPR) repeat protein